MGENGWTAQEDKLPKGRWGLTQGIPAVNALGIKRQQMAQVRGFSVAVERLGRNLSVRVLCAHILQKGNS